MKQQNPFDQFDNVAPVSQGNPFDQFDVQEAAAPAQRASAPAVEPQKPGFIEGIPGFLKEKYVDPVANFGRAVKQGYEGRNLGIQQLINDTLPDNPRRQELRQQFADKAKSLDENSVDGAAGVAGSIAGDPLTYLFPTSKGGGIVRGLLTGAGMGGASGVTSPVKEGDSRLLNAAIGAGVGGAAGVALPAVTKGAGTVKRGAGAAKQFFLGSSTDEQAAANALKSTAKQLQREGITADQLTRSAALSKEAGLGATLPEYAKSSNLIAKQKQIANQSGKASNYLRSYFKNRNEKLIPERLKQFSAPLLEKQQKASESYNKIWKEGNVQIDTLPLDEFIEGKIKTSLPGGQKQQLFTELKGLLSGAKEQGNSLRSLHEAKIEIDNLVKSAPTDGLKKILKAETVDTLSQLRSLMDKASPEYAATRRLYEEGTPGRKILTALEKSRVGSIADVRRRLFGNLEKQKELQRAMAPEQYRGMRLLARSMDDIISGKMGGSDTAFNQKAGKELLEETGAQGVEALTKPINATQRLANWYSEKVRQKDYEALAKLYTDPDIAALGEALKKVPRESNKALDAINTFAVRALANYAGKQDIQ